MQLKDLYGALFRRRPAIRSLDDLADFMDEHAAFLVQKGIFEYSRARSGHYSKVLFREQGFIDAVEAARWRAYPLGLAMIAELVEGTLRPTDPQARPAVMSALSRVVLDVFDRYPPPAQLGSGTWHSAREELAQRLQRISLHAPKPVMDIPEPYAKTYFDLMPIHKSLRGSDFPTLKSYLKITMCNIHDEFTKRLDTQSVGEQLEQLKARIS